MAKEIVHPQIVAVIAAALARYAEVTGRGYRLLDAQPSPPPAPPAAPVGAWRQSARLEAHLARAAFYRRS